MDLWKQMAFRGRIAPVALSTFAMTLRSAEDVVTRWTRRHGVSILRIGLGVVFFWFGVLKLFPGLSPAQNLIFDTIPFVDPRWFIKVLAVWEMAIGIGLIAGVYLRATLLLFFLHLPGTALPLILLPSATWTRFPFALTLEGQYIVKNIVLLGAALVLVTTTRKSQSAAARSGHDASPLSQPLPSLRTY